MDILKTIISFIIVFDLLVFVHEFGHFSMAKKNGVKVHEFSLGMGPAFFKKQKGETLYALRIFPIGGYVKMEGEDSDVIGPDSFNTKTPWQRFQILVMGAVNNIIFAFILMLILNFLLGVQTNTIDQVSPNSPAQYAGIQSGDEIVKVNDQGFIIWPQAAMRIDQSNDVTITVKRDGQEKEFSLTPKYNEEIQRKLVGVTVTSTKSIGNVASYTVRQMGFFAWTILDFFRQLFIGRADLNQVSGPVGIVTMVDQSAKQGIISIMTLTALLSLNLGVFNLLPLPALDGGRIFFLLIEILRGKPVPPEKEGIVHGIGFILLLILIVLVTFKDIMKLV